MVEAVRPSRTGLFAYHWETNSHIRRLRQLLSHMADKLGFDLSVTMASGGEMSLFKYLLRGG